MRRGRLLASRLSFLPDSPEKALIDELKIRAMLCL
jgi:hypothetical protein